jgi:hypothetical protein
MAKASHGSIGDESKPVTAEGVQGETKAETLTRVLTDPFWRHGLVAKGIVDKSLGKVPGDPKFDDYGKALQAKATNAATGDLKFATEMLVAQANSLDTMFAEFARRAALNMGDYINATESYSRIALKAQSNCRATLEALMKLHQPREQTVKHIHVNEGGQAVVADHFHAGGRENGKSIKQSHAAIAAGERTALPGPDAERDGVPVPSRERKAALPDARRNESGTA